MGRSFFHFVTIPVASLGWVTPGVATEGVTPPLFSWKTWRPFLLIAVNITITFYCFHSGVTPPGCHPIPFYLSDLVSPLFFVNLPTKFFFPSGVTPWRVSPGAVRPPSDATAQSTRLTDGQTDRWTAFSWDRPRGMQCIQGAKNKERRKERTTEHPQW